ncbi:MAG: hypothetical protein P4L41_03400 [Flavipsychrobacter sp.]|nr:hypothetical protein [Flavipsychrobacter sp.]
MKYLLLLAVFVCCLQSVTAQSKTPVHHRHYKKHSTVHKGNAHMRSKHNIKVGDANDNDYHRAYEGKSSRSNDGVKKNEQRNLNYQNQNANLAPSNGNNSK